MVLAILILSALSLIALVVLIILVLQQRTADRYEDILDKLSDQRRELNDAVHSALSGFGQLMDNGQRSFARQQNDNQQSFQQSVELRLDAFEKANLERLGSFEKTNAERLDGIRSTMEKRLSSLQEDNNKRLDQMQQVVDEKLQSTLENRISKSFEMVSKQLEAVYKGLGEMQQVAAGVTDLKKVLSNVKTRGILGEIQLGAILEEILSPEQYDTNVATRPGSVERVEYAVKLPGSGDEPVYLPIDAKFPGDTYAALMDAYDAGDPTAIASPHHPAQAGSQGRVLQVHRAARHHGLRHHLPALRGTLCRGGEPGHGGGIAEAIQGEPGRAIHHGRPAKQPADGLPHPGHRKAVQRGMGDTALRPHRVRQVRRRTGGLPEASAAGVRGPGPAGGRQDKADTEQAQKRGKAGGRAGSGLKSAPRHDILNSK